MWTQLVPRQFSLGEHYYVFGRPSMFIKVTAKGFNFLDTRTNKCIFRRHFYCYRFFGKNIPKELTTFSFKVPFALSRNISQSSFSKSM